ncbi:MAG TPA: hypothetical protein VM870_07775, partial [Pyrinomonadaceae bacterium]|nr:hypothetical protein [Pyrinomonadaceae bacterium]
MKTDHDHRRTIACLILFFACLVPGVNVYAGDDAVDTDTRFVNAQVTEVSDGRIAIIAATGVEHVIALDQVKTKVIVDGKEIALSEIKAGDQVTIELDAQNPVKLAQRIDVSSNSGNELAQVRRR